MKLHLPKLLRNAVLSCLAAIAGIATLSLGTANAISVSDGYVQGSFSTTDGTGTQTFGNITYNYDTGFVALASSASLSALTFDLKTGWTTESVFIKTDSDNASQGLIALADGTMRGAWQEALWSDDRNPTTSAHTLSVADGNDGSRDNQATVTLTAKKSEGTYLGTGTSLGNLYTCTDLKSSIGNNYRELLKSRYDFISEFSKKAWCVIISAWHQSLSYPPPCLFLIYCNSEEM